MNIAFCINRLALQGFGVTLSSLVQNCSEPARLHLWIIGAGLTQADKAAMGSLLEAESFAGRTSFVDFEPTEQFQAFPSLHGDWTAYGRLLLADLVQEEQVLYLDADLVVEADVLVVEHFDLGQHILAAVGGGRVKYTLGRHFYTNQVGLPPDMEYFNSGVLLLNLRLWRQDKIKEKCLVLAQQYGSALPSHDQSLLNLICAGNFAKLPPSFNCEWEAVRSRPETADRMILHYIGSPKPWDPFGKLMHNGYKQWAKYADATWMARYNRLHHDELMRVWHIRRSYARCLLNRWRNIAATVTPKSVKLKMS